MSRTAIRAEEITGLRSAARKVFRTGVNAYTAAVYPSDVHTYDAAQQRWETIDNTLVESVEGVTNRKNAACRVSMCRDHIRIENGQEDCLTLWLEGAKEQPPVVGKEEAIEEDDPYAVKDYAGRAVYPSALEGVDWVCGVYGTRFKDSAVITAREAAREIRFTVSGRGLRAEEGKDGIIFLDAEGKTAFHMERPVCWDAEHTPGAPEVRTELLRGEGEGEWILSCRMDEAWLDGAVYPVTLDPVIQTVDSTSAVSSAYTDSSEASQAHPGAYRNIRLSRGSGRVCNAYIQFAQRALPPVPVSAIIAKARLRVRNDGVNGYPNQSFDATAHRVTGGWDAGTLTWNNAPGHDAMVTDYSRFEHLEGGYLFHDYDITDIARGWYEDSTTNHGMMLQAQADTVCYLCANLSDPLAIGSGTYYHPLLEISYENHAGLEG